MCTLRTSSEISSRLVTAARCRSPSCSPDPGSSVLVDVTTTRCSADVTNLGAGVPVTGEVVFTTDGVTEYLYTMENIIIFIIILRVSPMLFCRICFSLKVTTSLCCWTT